MFSLFSQGKNKFGNFSCIVFNISTLEIFVSFALPAWLLALLEKKYFIFQEINLHVTGLGKRNILQSERPILADYIGDCDNSLINI